MITYNSFNTSMPKSWDINPKLLRALEHTSILILYVRDDYCNNQIEEMTWLISRISEVFIIQSFHLGGKNQDSGKKCQEEKHLYSKRPEMMCHPTEVETIPHRPIKASNEASDVPLQVLNGGCTRSLFYKSQLLSNRQDRHA